MFLLFSLSPADFVLPISLRHIPALFLPVLFRKASLHPPAEFPPGNEAVLPGERSFRSHIGSYDFCPVLHPARKQTGSSPPVSAPDGPSPASDDPRMSLSILMSPSLSKSSIFHRRSISHAHWEFNIFFRSSIFSFGSSIPFLPGVSSMAKEIETNKPCRPDRQTKRFASPGGIIISFRYSLIEGAVPCGP